MEHIEEVRVPGEIVEVEDEVVRYVDRIEYIDNPIVKVVDKPVRIEKIVERPVPVYEEIIIRQQIEKVVEVPVDREVVVHEYYDEEVKIPVMREVPGPPIEIIKPVDVEKVNELPEIIERREPIFQEV